MLRPVSYVLPWIIVLVATLSRIIGISVATQKVCRDRVLPPLSLFPCCSFIFDVTTWTFVLGMFCTSRPQYVMSLRHFSVCSIFSYRDLVFFCRNINFLPSACLCVMTHISCRDKTFLCSADLCGATSKHLFSLKYVATLTLLVATKFISSKILV